MENEVITMNFKNVEKGEYNTKWNFVAKLPRVSVGYDVVDCDTDDFGVYLFVEGVPTEMKRFKSVKSAIKYAKKLELPIFNVLLTVTQNLAYSYIHSVDETGSNVANVEYIYE